MSGQSVIPIPETPSDAMIILSGLLARPLASAKSLAYVKRLRENCQRKGPSMPLVV